MKILTPLLLMSCLSLGDAGLTSAEPSLASPGPEPVRIVEPVAPVLPIPGATEILDVLKSADPGFFGAAVELVDLANSIFEATGLDIDVWPLWYCRFADGTIVYNKFRFYRDGAAVSRYFTGRPDSHDCDAWYMDGRGRRVRFCTTDAEAFARAHGGIVSIGRAG